MELVSATSDKLGAFPAGFLSNSQLVSDSDRQWIYDQLPSNVQGSAGTLWYRNQDEIKFTQSVSNKRSLLFLLKGEVSGAVFGAFTQARLYFEPFSSNDFRDTTSFLFNVNDKKKWACLDTFDETVETEDNGSWKWVFFSKHDDVHDLSIRNSAGFQAANSRANLAGYNVDRDRSGNNQLTKSIDGREVKLSIMEVWEI